MNAAISAATAAMPAAINPAAAAWPAAGIQITARIAATNPSTMPISATQNDRSASSAARLARVSTSIAAARTSLTDTVEAGHGSRAL